MKPFYYLLAILFAMSLQSCRNNLNLPTPASRNYQQDAAVLNDFVDINKTTHEYYINPNKKSSALSYLTNTDAEELNAVNSLNLSTFKESLNAVNGLSGQSASSQWLDYIVMITQNEVYISQVNRNSIINLNRSVSDKSTVSRSTIATCNVTDYKEKYNFNSLKTIETSIELYPQAYKNAGWAFLVTCEVEHNGDKESANVLFCGVGYHINPCFEWSVSQGYETDWKFEVANMNGEEHIANLQFLH